MFYFFFESRKDPKSDPLVVWMTGALLTKSLTCSLSHNGATTRQRNECYSAGQMRAAARLAAASQASSTH